MIGSAATLEPYELSEMIFKKSSDKLSQWSSYGKFLREEANQISFLRCFLNSLE